MKAETIIAEGTRNVARYTLYTVDGRLFVRIALPGGMVLLHETTILEVKDA